MVDTQVPAAAPARLSSAAARAKEERRWRRAFLATLAATSNVTASAKVAQVTTARAYEARRKDAAFYRAWQEALCEGYEHLEMALLQRLREGEIKRAAGAKVGVRVFDNATSLRLLVAHRESVTRQQAIRSNQDAREVIAQITARIEKLRPARVIEAAPAGVTDAEPDDTATGDATHG